MNRIIESGLLGAIDPRFSAIRAHVALKNWPALRFWTKRGYNKAIKYHEDPIYGEDKFASFVLEKKINSGSKNLA